MQKHGSIHDHRALQQQTERQQAMHRSLVGIKDALDTVYVGISEPENHVAPATGYRAHLCPSVAGAQATSRRPGVPRPSAMRYPTRSNLSGQDCFMATEAPGLWCQI